MKNLLYLIIIALLCTANSCGSDDEDDIIKVEESKIDRYNYYNSAKHHIYLPRQGGILYNEVTGEFIHPVSDARCPNRKDHLQENDIYRAYFSTEEGSRHVLKCHQCGAEFHLYTGKPLNEQAQGYILQTYEYDYDKENKIYYLKKPVEERLFYSW